MKLKLKNISNLDAFFHVINQCDGAVELSLPEGGSVNLKSRLSQYLSPAPVFSHGTIRALDLTTHTLSAAERRINYMGQGSSLLSLLRWPGAGPLSRRTCPGPFVHFPHLFRLRVR